MLCVSIAAAAQTRRKLRSEPWTILKCSRSWATPPWGWSWSRCRATPRLSRWEIFESKQRAITNCNLILRNICRTRTSCRRLWSWRMPDLFPWVTDKTEGWTRRTIIDNVGLRIITVQHFGTSVNSQSICIILVKNIWSIFCDSSADNLSVQLRMKIQQRFWLTSSHYFKSFRRVFSANHGWIPGQYLRNREGQSELFLLFQDRSLHSRRKMFPNPQQVRDWE